MAAVDTGPWRVGDRITSGYEIRGVLGRGGMGIVYGLFDHDSGSVLAAKTFLGSGELKQRFVQEARAWVELDVHPNVVRAYFVREIGGRPVVFMEFLPGGDLAMWIRSERPTAGLDEVLLLGIQFCDGMQHAVSKGVHAHRDVKPQNCLLGASGILKVSDLGLAKVYEQSEPSRSLVDPGASAAEDLTQTGGMAGTPAYMAPEQWGDAKHVDLRADVYSFGVMLFEMLSGERPFRGTAADLQRLHQQQAPPRLEGFGAELDQLLQTCLAKRPEDRFASFGEVRQALASVYSATAGKPPPEPETAGELTFGDQLNKAMSLGRLGMRQEELAMYDQMLQSASAIDNPELAELVAMTMLNKAATLDELGRWEEEISLYHQVIARFGNATNAALLAQVARALYNEAAVLDVHLGRAENAIGIYDQVVETFGVTGHSAISELVAQAMVNKATLLDRSARQAEAVGVYDEVIHRFAASTNPGVLEQVARAEFNKGCSLGELGRLAEEIATYDELVERFGDARYRVLWEPVADALINKAVALSRLERNQDALRVYDAVAERFGDVPEPLLQARVAKAMVGKGAVLIGLGQLGEAAVAYSEVVDRFVETTEPAIQEHVAEGMLRLGQTLGRVDEAQQALGTYDMLVGIYGNAPQRAIREKVASALASKGATLALGNLPANAVVALDQLVEMFGDAHEPELREQVGQALFMKGEIFQDRERFEVALDCYRRAESFGVEPAAQRISECEAELAKSGASAAAETQATVQAPSSPAVFSPDGAWWWNGTSWVSAVSADGLWRWNGTEWVSVASDPRE